MLIRILFLELRKNLKSPAFYIFFLIFFSATLLFTLTTDPYTQVMGVAHGKEWHNAPIIIARMMTNLGVIGLLFTMVIIGRAVAKDFEVNIHELIFTRPISKLQYLGGRFAGSYLANLILFLGIIFGFEAGLAFLDPRYSGPFRPGTYLLPLILLIVPNLLLMGGIMFSLATLTRRMIATYLAGIAFLGVFAVLEVMLHRMDNETLKVLLDPFGITGLIVSTQYWTVTDMNNLLIPVNGVFAVNRIIWLSVAVSILWVTFRKFEFVSIIEKRNGKTPVVSDNTALTDYNIRPPEISLKGNKFFGLSQCISVSWRDFRRIIIHPAFIILTLLALTEIVTNFIGGLGNQSGHMYPFTSWFLRQTIHIWIYMLPMTIFFGGILVWKDKDHQTDEIINSLPIPNWFGYTSKLLTLSGIYVFYLLLTMLSGMFAQMFILDFREVEPGLYIRQLFGVDFFVFLHMAVVVLFIQNLSPNKYIGFLWSALFFTADLIIFGVSGFDDHLFRYGRVPDFIYSNLNGFGHYGQMIFWYTIYWLFFGAVLAWLTILLWRRTAENSIRLRFRHMRSNLTGNQIKGLSVLIVMFIVTGLFIGYNKYILNPYFPEKKQHRMQADYERKFAGYSNKPQPTILGINLTVDLFPGDRTAKVRGEYLLFNHHDESIREFYVNLNDWNLSNSKPIWFDRPVTKKLHSVEFGFRVFELDKPLQPGDTLTMQFQYDIEARGFTENHPKNEIVANGTCLVLSSFSSAYFPVIGYNVNNEILDDRHRKEFGLAAKPDAPDASDAVRTRAIFAVSRPNFEAVISTSIDQTVISSGSLVDRRQKDGRNIFHYRSDTIIENEIPIISGRYESVRENYDNVSVEVYYHPGHDYNLKSILEGLKDSYDYGNRYFSDYPYRVLRVVEIPNYMTEGAARHFPTTFVWVETEGFITRYQEGDIDIVYGIAAHENAHHWWAGIVTPAHAEGAFMLTETLAQYVMAILTEKKFGYQTGRDYLKLEMESYLRRRKHDTEGEKPLAESSVRQSYIGYKKSSVVMNALKDYIGEDSVGAALNRIVEKYGYRLDTFPLATDLVNEFLRVAPDSLRYLVDDLFKKITLYESRIISAVCSPAGDGKYEALLDVEIWKYYADSVGNQMEAPIRDYIYVGLMDETGEAFYYRKHLFTGPFSTIRLVTDRMPASAGIDPFLVLIDREMDNNVCPVKPEKHDPLTQMIGAPLKSACDYLMP
ncbi:MAG: hypothetical protein JW861_08340 [Bacteroidales bacterium]|nr:hypothetical protein [Bacteroidales bacterium]